MDLKRGARGLLLALLLAGPVLAQDLTPEAYVRADTEAREVTLEGMAARLEMIAAGADLEAQMELAERYRARVDEVFQSHQTDGAAHAAYGTRHWDTIEAWLAAHPGWQQRYTELDTRFEALSRQFSASATGGQ